MRPEALRQQLKKAYRRLLNPLVRILIRSGITAPEMCELVRLVYVDVATAGDFEVPREGQTETRVAILTGLSRREINRLKAEDTTATTGTNLSQIGRITAGWNQDPEFTGPYGLPLAVPFEDDPAVDAPSFCELVKRHSPDMAPRAMLDELLRTGLAQIDDDGLIRSTGRTYIPSKLDPEAIERLGSVLTRIADTLDLNNQVDDPGLGRMERHVITDIGLTDEQYEQFNIYLRQKCQQLLETLDNWIGMQEGRIGKKGERLPPPDSTGKRITGVGVYHFLDEKLPFEDGYVERPDQDSPENVN